MGVTLNSAIIRSPPRTKGDKGRELCGDPMDRMRVEKVLRDLKENHLTVGEAMERLRALPYDDLGFAKVDMHRPLRRGFPEAVYCPGKTDAQIVEIIRRLAEASNVVLATR